MKPFIRKSFAHAVLALGLVGAPVAVSGLVLVPSAAYAQSAPTIEQMKSTLAAYGEFITSGKYGEVWKPTVTPRGWHPYPACEWTYTKDFGWYFNDKTPWGKIVHHYGRWTHDETDGWLWVPGAEFSPGWVAWRTSADWVGWAPTPPEVDMTAAQMAKFDDDKLWTFMDAKKFGNDCQGGVVVASRTPVLLEQTTYVTDMRFYNGVGIFVLPVSGPVVNVDIDIFAPWSSSFIGTWIWNWNTVFNDVDINIVVVNNKTCEPGKQPERPPLTHVNAPPPPPNLGRDRRQPERLRQDLPRRQPQPDRRTRVEFEPQPDDVIEEVRQPRRPRDRQPDFVRERQPDFERGPRREREPRRDREVRERQPDFDQGDNGRRPRREARDRQPERFLDEGFRPRRERQADGGREDFGRMAGGREPRVERFREPNGGGFEARRERSGLTFDRR